MPTPPFNSLVPLAQVADVNRSMAFYGALGFAVRNTFTPPDERDPVWASLESGGACLMLARADEPVVPKQQGVLFYLYCPDVSRMKAALEAAGVAASPITYPFYAPEGEFRVEDPDGYTLMITHT